TIEDNSISNNKIGIIDWAESADNNVITNNTIINNEIGIEIYGDDNTIKYNMIKNNLNKSVYVPYGDNNIFRNNLITGGIWLDSCNNMIYENDFVCLTNLRDNCWSNAFNTSVIGNYYDDYQGNDTNEDGIGDIPYDIPGDANHKDYLPSMNLINYIDTTSPSVNIISPEDGATSYSQNANLTVTWNGNDDTAVSYYEIKFGNNSWINCGGEKSHNFVHLQTGEYIIIVKAVDSVGNEASDTIGFTLICPSIELSLSCSSAFVGYEIGVSGNLTWIDQDMTGEELTIFNDRTGLIKSVTTGEKGVFSFSWLPTVSGKYEITAQWGEYQEIITLAVTSHKDESVFSVVSNSVVTGLAFNSEEMTLSFKVNGTSGTWGFVNVTITKTLVENAADLMVTLDGENLTYNVISTNGAWVLNFVYLHSSHDVAIGIDSTQGGGETQIPGYNLWVLIISVSVLSVIVIKKMKFFTKCA
ncbi:MAG: right-handed parallel beta-helix repeat-containing protein, partial [Promethearchaeota archaeon]